VLVVVVITAALAWLSARAFREYGWGLFVGLPFFLGLTSSVLHGYRVQRGFWSCVTVAALATMILAGVFIGIAFEGVICILMAAPIAFVLAVLGATVGYFIQARPQGGRDAGTVVSSLVLVLPGVFALRDIAAPAVRAVGVTPVRLVAPRELGRRTSSRSPKHRRRRLHLPRRRRLPAARRDRRHGSGRRAPLRVLDRPVRRADRGVGRAAAPRVHGVAQPPSMRELSPYPEITPPHLEHFLESHRGRFLLEKLDGGGEAGRGSRARPGTRTGCGRLRTGASTRTRSSTASTCGCSNTSSGARKATEAESRDVSARSARRAKGHAHSSLPGRRRSLLRGRRPRLRGLEPELQHALRLLGAVGESVPARADARADEPGDARPSRVAARSAATVVDMGCGLGATARYVAEKRPRAR
jgi:hypothetical protein